VVTRFADLSPEEFGNQHATYAAGHTLKEHSGVNSGGGGGNGGVPGGGGGGGGNRQNAAAARNRKHLGEQQPQQEQRAQRQQQRRQQRQQQANIAAKGGNGIGSGGGGDLHQAQLGARSSVRPSSNLAFPAALYNANAGAHADADVDFTLLDDADVPGTAPEFTSHAAAFDPGTASDMDEEITSSAAAYLGKDSEKTATAKPIDSNHSAPSPEEVDEQETALPGDIGLPDELDWQGGHCEQAHD